MQMQMGWVGEWLGEYGRWLWVDGRLGGWITCERLDGCTAGKTR